MHGWFGPETNRQRNPSSPRLALITSLARRPSAYQGSLLPGPELNTCTRHRLQILLFFISHSNERPPKAEAATHCLS